jgi:hypothetical protein
MSKVLPGTKVNIVDVFSYEFPTADPQEVGCGVIDWIEMAQNRDRWRALVNAGTNLRVP